MRYYNTELRRIRRWTNEVKEIVKDKKMVCKKYNNTKLEQDKLNYDSGGKKERKKRLG